MRIAKGGFFCLVMMSEFAALGVGPTGVYTQKNLPKWQIEMNERAKELEELQRKNGSDDVYVPGKVIDFPSTVDDLSFSARQQLTTESLEPFKNLKAYREIDVKTASEWCSGEHSNTTECWEWRCSENNQKANTPICITYNCTKQDYYSAHKQECDLNKACLKGQNSTECMKYKCYNTNEKNICDEEGEYVVQIRKRQLKRELREGNTGTTGRGCFAQCGEAISDNLNNRALYPVMGKYYCADSDRNGLVVENDNRTTTLKLTQAQLDKLKNLIVSSVANKDKCDGHVRNYIMFIGKLIQGDFSETEEIYLDD